MRRSIHVSDVTEVDKKLTRWKGMYDLDEPDEDGWSKTTPQLEGRELIRRQRLSALQQTEHLLMELLFYSSLHQLLLMEGNKYTKSPTSNTTVEKSPLPPPPKKPSIRKQSPNTKHEPKPPHVPGPSYPNLLYLTNYLPSDSAIEMILKLQSEHTKNVGETVVKSTRRKSLKPSTVSQQPSPIDEKDEFKSLNRVPSMYSKKAPAIYESDDEVESKHQQHSPKPPSTQRRLSRAASTPHKRPTPMSEDPNNAPMQNEVLSKDHFTKYSIDIQRTEHEQRKLIQHLTSLGFDAFFEWNRFLLIYNEQNLSRGNKEILNLTEIEESSRKCIAEIIELSGMVHADCRNVMNKYYQRERERFQKSSRDLQKKESEDRTEIIRQFRLHHSRLLVMEQESLERLVINEQQTEDRIEIIEKRDQIKPTKFVLPAHAEFPELPSYKYNPQIRRNQELSYISTYNPLISNISVNSSSIALPHIPRPPNYETTIYRPRQPNYPTLWPNANSSFTRTNYDWKYNQHLPSLTLSYAPKLYAEA